MRKLLTIALIGFMLVACSASKNQEQYQRYSDESTTSGFDTVMTLLAYTQSKDEFDHYFEVMKDEFTHYNALYDKYNSYEGINNIKTINDNAGIQPVEVDQEIINMLLLAKQFTEISDYFDITLGSMLKIWHDYREEGIALNSEGKPGNVPSREILEDAMQYTGWDKVVIDDDANTVYLTETRTELDVGAVAKGYATEMVALKLEAEGLKYGVVSGGGNIRTINTKPDGTPWAIGIQEPSNLITSSNIDILNIPYSTSIVTSGDYQRTYWGPDKVQYSHLINPKTLFPATNFRSVSIITKNSGMADALSTVLYMMTYEEGVEFIKNYNEKFPENRIDAFWIMNENQSWYHGENFDYTMTPDLIQYSKNQSQ